MEMMIKKLEEASIEGNVTTLLELIKQDSLILDRQIIGCYNETPLHVSSMLGHIHFTNEILSRKPEMASETNTPTKSTPLHLASAKGCVEVVKSLLTASPETCFAIDTNGRNPCHVAAMKGRIGVLKELVQVEPFAVKAFAEKDGEKETILHLCVKYNQFEVLKFLVEIIGDDHEFVNFMDGDGGTILHLAVAVKQIEVIKFIIGHTKVEVNAKNANGYTALDILAQSRRDANDMLIFESLQLVGALKSKHLSFPLNHHQVSVDHPIRIMVDQRDNHNDNNQEVFLQKTNNWLEKKYNVLMLVASLIATMAFQAGISPAGGIWQDNFHDPIFRLHYAGKSIMADTEPWAYTLYVILDTISFISALSIILLLISGLPLKRRCFVWILMVIMWISVSSLALTYSHAIQLYVPDRIDGHATIITVLVIVYLWTALIGLVLLVHTVRLIVKAIKTLVRFIRRRRAVSNSFTMMNDNHV